jgi:peptidoglycan hydrolase CwlO-like protein
MATAGRFVVGQINLGTVLQAVILAVILWSGNMIADTVKTAALDHQVVAGLQTSIAGFQNDLHDIKNGVGSFNQGMNDLRARQLELDHRMDCLQGVVPSNECRRVGRR